MGGQVGAAEGVGAPGRDRKALAAFILLVLLGGANAVAVRFSNLELPPFWGAAFRFNATALIFWGLVLARRMPLPRGRSLVGPLLYGVLSVGASYAFLYWGLLRVQAGMTMVVLALVPLLTQFLAWAHGLEPLRWRGLIGAVTAFIGIVIGVREGLGAAAPVASLLSLVAGAACIAEGSIVYKIFPESDPLTTNALAVTTGGIMLTGISLIAGERWIVPTETSTWLAFVYLTLVGSVLLFYLYLVVLDRWTATATSYSFLLFPIATVVLAGWLAGEVITAWFVIGGMLVLAGVWLAAISGAPRIEKREGSPTPEEVPGG